MGENQIIDILWRDGYHTAARLLENRIGNVFQNVIDLLPRHPNKTDDNPGIWTNGDEILCETEIIANTIADLFEAVGFDVVTGYYDPIEDKRNGEEDESTGFYYVTIS